MPTIKRTKRKRCCCCRKWFYPHPSAQGQQKTCSPGCRARQKGLLAKRRRDLEVQNYRVDERERQRKHRRQVPREEVKSGSDPANPPQLSRAGLSPQPIDLKEVILKKWDKQVRLSRACLRRDLEDLLGVSGENWDKVGQKPPPVTSHPFSVTTS